MNDERAIVRDRLFLMDYKILGDVMQALQLNLHQGEEIYAEAGAMLYMGPGIDFQAKMQGGLMKGLMRKFLAGESNTLRWLKMSDLTRFAPVQDLTGAFEQGGNAGAPHHIAEPVPDQNRADLTQAVQVADCTGDTPDHEP